MKTKTMLRNEALSLRNILKATFYSLLGALLAGGKLIPSAHPFGISLCAALSGGTQALAATLGAIAGSLRLTSGGIHAAVISGVFIARLLLGKWLYGGNEEKGETVCAVSPKIIARLALKAKLFITSAMKTSFNESLFIRMTLSGAASMLYGAVRCAENGYATRDLIGALIASLASPLLVFLYSYASASDNENSHSVLKEAGKCALAASLVMSLDGITPYFDAAVPAAFVITMLVTRDGGTFIGMIYGIVCGIVLSPALAPMYALASLTAGALYKYSPAIAVTGACSVSAAWSIYSLGLEALSTTVPELIITSAIFAPIASSSLLPTPSYVRKGINPAIRDDVPSFILRRESVKKMRSLSDSMNDLSGVLYRLSEKLTSPEVEQLCELCENSFEESCCTCGMRSACFGREAEQTAALQARMTLALKNESRVSASLVPQAMAKRCYSMGQIIDRMNAGCARMISEAKLYDRTSVVAADYEVMSEMLKDSANCESDDFELDADLTHRVNVYIRGIFKAEHVGVFGTRTKKVIARGVDVKGGTPGADDVRELFSDACGFTLSEPEFELSGSQVIMKLQSLPKFSVRCGRASIAMSELGSASVSGAKASADGTTKVFSLGDKGGIGKTSSEACGDVISAFMTSDGRFFMLISDGMGSGKDAALTSGVCAVFIEKLLKAGASMDTSLKMLNSMMRVRGNEVAASVDLMELDLMSGSTRFVKSGAAPSFVLRGGRLFRLQSKTVPIGIVRALDAEMIKFETEPGDVIVMLSDGVTRSFEECPWLYDLLCDEREWSSDPEKMAKKIIKYAIKNGADDDITAGVVMIE